MLTNDYCTMHHAVNENGSAEAVAPVEVVRVS